MPRRPRAFLADFPHHVTQRGNNRGRIFCGDLDRRHFLHVVFNALQESKCELHAYVLMSNHVHFLVTPRESVGLSSFMRSVGQRHAQYFNARHHRSGALWEGRFKAGLVGSEAYLLNCYRYIELNPVRAGLVADPAEYPWSSIRHNALGEPNPLVTPHVEYELLGFNRARRLERYRALIADGMDLRAVEEVRVAVNQGRAYASERFRSRAERLLNCRLGIRPQGRPRTRNKGSDPFLQKGV